MAVYRLRISNNWRDSLCGEGHSLIVTRVLDMIPNVIGAECIFTYCYTVILDSRANWKGDTW